MFIKYKTSSKSINLIWSRFARETSFCTLSEIYLSSVQEFYEISPSMTIAFASYDAITWHLQIKWNHTSLKLKNKVRMRKLKVRHLMKWNALFNDSDLFPGILIIQQHTFTQKINHTLRLQRMHIRSVDYKNNRQMTICMWL